MEELKGLINRQGMEVSEKDGAISLLGVTLGDEKVSIDIFFEPAEFEISVSNFIILDKVEDQNLSLADIEPFILDFIKCLRNQGITLWRHTFFASAAYSLSFNGSSIPHTSYESVWQAVVKKLGKKSKVGALNLQSNAS